MAPPDRPDATVVNTKLKWVRSAPNIASWSHLIEWWVTAPESWSTKRSKSLSVRVIIHHSVTGRQDLALIIGPLFAAHPCGLCERNKRLKAAVGSANAVASPISMPNSRVAPAGTAVTTLVLIHDTRRQDLPARAATKFLGCGVL